MVILTFALCVSGCAEAEEDRPSHGFRPPWHHASSTEDEAPEAEEEQPERHLRLSVTDPGYDVFTPGKGISYDYRYGPSILLEDDGGMDAWFSSPADGNELDWITYRHSEDGGETWGNEKVVLSPTPGSKDAMSVCDPDVFYYDGFYYIGYTSTIDPTKQGLANSVFLARSQKPDGPYEKWNGNGWGGAPEPIIYYDGMWNGWGVGEPSFVVLDDTIYVYSTRDSYTSDNQRIKSTEVRTADITEENWPANLDFIGYAAIRTDNTPLEAEKWALIYNTEDDYVFSDCDSWDVAYVEEADKFVAICTNRRLDDDSCLLYFESDNGIHFERVSELNANVYCGCHNAGIMGDGLAHIKKDDPMLVGYAYSGTNNDEWGTWATRFAPISIEVVEDIDSNEDGMDNLKLPINYRSRLSDPWPIFITAESLISYATSEGSVFNIYYHWIDSDKGMHPVSSKDINFLDYDEDAIEVNDGRVVSLSKGETIATIEYKGVTRHIIFRTLSDEVSANDASTDAAMAIVSPVGGYKASLSVPYAVCIRPLVKFKDYAIKELDIEGIMKHGIVFESGDEDICEVRADGLLTPISPGETKITVSCGNLRYKVNISVIE